MADSFLKVDIEFNIEEDDFAIEIEACLQYLNLTSTKYEFKDHHVILYLSYPFPVRTYLENRFRQLNGYVKHKMEPAGQPVEVHKLEEELNSVGEALKGLHKSIEIVFLTHATVDQIEDLLDSDPGYDVLHIISHGTEAGTILLEDSEKPGWARHINSGELADIVSSNVSIFINSACYGENSVLALKLPENGERPDVIIHSSGKFVIPARVIYRFSEKFYQKLTNGESAEVAFEKGVKHVKLDVEIGERKYPDGAYDDGGPSPYKRIVIDQNSPVSYEDITDGQVESKEITPPQIPHSKIRRDSDIMIGRQVDVALVIKQLAPPIAGLRSDRKRLVNLHGEGGIGKTRIALSSCDKIVEYGLFPGGIFEVDCQYASDTNRLAHAILVGINFPKTEEIPDPIEALTLVLKSMTDQSGETLLLLDNLDDLFSPNSKELKPHPGELLVNVLTQCPQIKILSTCRTELNIGPYEADFHIEPLKYSESRKLLIEFLPDQNLKTKFRNLSPDEKSLLDNLLITMGGHPLSIFLTAYRISNAKENMTERLKNAKDQFMEQLEAPDLVGFPERQKSLQVSLDLSYNLLSENAKVTFRKSSFFPGGLIVPNTPGFDDLLGEEWQKEIEETKKIGLYRFNENPNKYIMLNPIREYAESKLEIEEETKFNSDSLDYWLKFTLWFDSILSAFENPERLKNIGLPTEQKKREEKLKELENQAYSALSIEEANILHAFRWAVENDFKTANNIADRIQTYLALSGNIQTRLWVCYLMYEKSADDENKARWATDLTACFDSIGNIQKQIVFAKKSISLYNKLFIVSPDKYAFHHSRALSNLGVAYIRKGKYTDAMKNLEEALSKIKHFKAPLVIFKYEKIKILLNLGVIYIDLERPKEALLKLEEALFIMRKLLKNDPHQDNNMLFFILLNMGVALSNLKEFNIAKGRLVEALEIGRELLKKYPNAYALNVSDTLKDLGHLLSEQNENIEAIEKLEEALRYQIEMTTHVPLVALPKAIATQILLRNIYGKLNEREQVLKCCVGIINSSTELSVLHNNLGILVHHYIEQANYLSGINEKQKALEYIELAIDMLKKYPPNSRDTKEALVEAKKLHDEIIEGL